MNLNWASPWEEEETAEPAAESLQLKAPVPKLPIENHHTPWETVEEEGRDWRSNVQNSWKFSSGQHEPETRVSEPSGWATSEDEPSPGLPAPLRKPSPDPWAGVLSLKEQRAEVHHNVVGLQASPQPQESENENHKQIGTDGIEKEPKSRRDSENLIVASELAEALEVDKSLQTQSKLKTIENELPSLQQIAADAISSRPSSSLSGHDEGSTESSRTSFEQDPTQDSSKVKKLVSHFDCPVHEVEVPPTLTRTESFSENKSIETDKLDDTSAEEDPDDDDFGEFEEEIPNSGVRSFPVDDVKGGTATIHHDVAFDINLSLVEKLLPDMVPETFQKPISLVNEHMDEDIFTTIEERKAWHRISRYGTMRKHNSGNDENYRRVKWESSKIREETIQIVSRWRTEDSTSGSVVLGSGNRGSIFGWDDKNKRHSVPVNMSAIWAERAERVSKHRSIPLQPFTETASKSTPIVTNQAPMDNPKSPFEPSVRFAWSTEDTDANNKSNQSLSPAPSSSFSLAPPPPSSPSTSMPSSLPLPAHSSIRPASVDYSRHPRIASIKGLGHRSTMSLDRKPPRPTPAPVMPVKKSVLPAPNPEPPLSESQSHGGNDEDDWGDMVSSSPELDAVFAVLDSAPQEPMGSRNRADSAPGVRASEQVLTAKRPLTMQPGALPSSSLTYLAHLDSNLDLSNTGLLEADQRGLGLSIKIPPSDPTPTLPKLSSIPDDLDPWGSTPAAPVTETVANTSTTTSTQQTSSSKLSVIQKDDFDAWASFDDFSTPVPEKSVQPTSATATTTAVSLVTPSKLEPLSANIIDKMDGWGDADLSLFESTLSPRPHTAKSPRKQLPKSSASKGSENEASNTGALSTSEKNGFNDRSEEDRIVQSIVSKLPDLSYMFRA